MAEDEGEETPVEETTPETPKADSAPSKEKTAPAEEAPKVKGKGKKVAAMAIVLVIVIGLVVALAMFGEDLFGNLFKSKGQDVGGGDAGAAMITVGTPGATSTVSKEGAQAIAEEFKEDDTEVYTYCKELNSGDKIATLGDAAKYDVSGPVWFVFVDEDPYSWYEHPVKYVFIDSATGAKTVYDESWPPEVNNYEIEEAMGSECPDDLPEPFEMEADESEFPDAIEE